jgi:cytochrome oxidase assembly protein ShyY1
VPGLDLWRRHQQFIALVLMAVLVALGCIGLSRWQYHRYQHKHEAKQLVQRNYDAPAVPLSRLLPSADAAFDRGDEWRQVRVSGQYDVAAATLVRNRPRDVGDTGPTYGYEVLVPLVLADGSALLVDRGWLPNGTTGSHPGQQPDAVPAPPAGQVQVVARLRQGEPRHGQAVPSGQVASIDLDTVEARAGRPLYPAYGALVSEAPAPSTAPAVLGAPELDGGEGINASYAVQWLLFAALALGFPFWYVRRVRREAAAALAQEAAERTAAGGSPSSPPDAPVAVPNRRRRIWDDEDE